MSNLLQQAIHIPITEYGRFEAPKFKSQTTADSSGKYWVIFEADGVLYKIHCCL